jgi:acetyltransferase-like isoleucine patch superfamily enzyme
MNFLYLVSKAIKKLHIPAIKNSFVERTARVCSGSQVVDSSLGQYSYVGNFCTVISASIGKFCSISDNCVIGGANHPLDWVSSSPIFHNGKNILRKNYSEFEFEIYRKTYIGNDVWIGSHCLIKNGLKIGNGAVIGMGSVLTKDVGDYEIWAGNPAKLIRKRFDDITIDKLTEINWWDWSEEVITKNATFFNSIDDFLRNNET